MGITKLSPQVIIIRTSLINGQWGLMGINNVPFILMGINGYLWNMIDPH